MVTFYKKQEPCLQNRHTDEIVCQTFLEGRRMYCSFADKFSFAKYVKSDPHCNELLFGNCSTFFDLDAPEMTLEKLGWSSEPEFIEEFTAFLIDGFQEHLGVQIQKKHVLWAKSSRPEKLSYHIIVKTPDFYWPTEQKGKDLRRFVKLLSAASLQRQGFYYLCEGSGAHVGEISMQSLLDTGIYTKNRCFRSLGCTKPDLDCPLLPMRNAQVVPLTEALVRKYCVTIPDSELEDRDPFVLKTESTPKKPSSISKGILDQLATQFNSRVVKIEGSLIHLRNTGPRYCPIAQETNTSDNAFFIKKHGCLFLGCHNAECQGKLHKVFQFDSRFTYYEDYQKIMKVPATERGKSLIVEYLQSTVSFVDKPDESFFITYSKAPLRSWKALEGKHCIISKNLFQRNSDIVVETRDGKVSFNALLRNLVQSRQLRTYNSTGWCPFVNQNPVMFPRNKINLFSGFVLDDNSIYTDVDFTKTQTFDLLQRLCDFQEPCVEYLLDFIALRLQKCGEIKPGIAICFLNSFPGSGKGTFACFLKALFSCSRQTVVSYNKLKQFTSVFNQELQYALFCILEEISSKVREVEGLIKDMCTTTEIMIEPKNENRRVENFYGTLMLFSNKIRCLNISRNDRRMCVLSSNSDKANNKEYFDQIYKELADVRTMRSAFVFFQNRDISRFDFRKFPKTKLRERVQTCSDSFEHKFYKYLFKEIYVGQYSYEFTERELYQHWREFSEEYGAVIRRDRGYVTASFESFFDPVKTDNRYSITATLAKNKLG